MDDVTPLSLTKDLQGPASSEARVSFHTHISGLGLKPNGEAELAYQGMVGQLEAREAAGMIIELAKAKKIAGKAILLAGPPGTGKTAIAVAMSKELGKKVPFCTLVASEIFSREVKKTEVLHEHLRRAMGLRIREMKEFYEGEITELTAQECPNPHGGFSKTVEAVILTLKTAKGTRTLKLAPKIHESLQKQKVRVGDVVYLEAQTGFLKRVGRCDAYASEYDLETEEFVPLPKGNVFKKKEVVQDITLHDLDVANSKPQGGSDILSVLSQFQVSKKTEITEKLRDEVNKIVDKYINEGLAQLYPGILFVDEAHMLDMQCFAFLNRAIESPNSPILVLGTNRGICKIRGADDTLSPHGMPVDLLDRLLIIKTIPFNVEEIVQIITLRAEIEGIKLAPEAAAKLGQLGFHASLRYALQLLTPASILCSIEGRAAISHQDVAEVDSLFLDAKASAKDLLRQAETSKAVSKTMADSEPAAEPARGPAVEPAGEPAVTEMQTEIQGRMGPDMESEATEPTTTKDLSETS